MEGIFIYRIQVKDDLIKLEFKEKVHPKGIMKIAKPIIRASYNRILPDRLNGIKRVLEELEKN